MERIQKSPVRIPPGNTWPDLQADENYTVIDRTLKIYDRTIDFSVAVTDTPVGLSHLVPLARRIADLVSAAAIDNLPSNKSLACTKACPGGCCRYLILLSVPEAFSLVQAVAEMDIIKRKSVIDTCQSMAERIYANLPKPPADINNPEVMTKYKADITAWFCSDAYNSLQMDCPFLHKNLCTIYEIRPIACRDWLVKDDHARCAKGSVHNKNVIDLPLHLAHILKQTTAKLENAPEEVVALPCTFDWFDANKARLTKTWPAKILTEQFLDTLDTQPSDLSS